MQLLALMRDLSEWSLRCRDELSASGRITNSRTSVPEVVLRLDRTLLDIARSKLKTKATSSWSFREEVAAEATYRLVKLCVRGKLEFRGTREPEAIKYLVSLVVNTARTLLRKGRNELLRTEESSGDIPADGETEPSEPIPSNVGVAVDMERAIDAKAVIDASGTSDGDDAARSYSPDDTHRIPNLLVRVFERLLEGVRPHQRQAWELVHRQVWLLFFASEPYDILLREQDATDPKSRATALNTIMKRHGRYRKRMVETIDALFEDEKITSDEREVAKRVLLELVRYDRAEAAEPLEPALPPASARKRRPSGAIPEIEEPSR
jgi:hypothetical protein